MTADLQELDYEQQRLQNIRDNQALLLSLGLSTPTKLIPSKPNTSLRKKANLNARRRTLEPSEEKQNRRRSYVSQNADNDSVSDNGLRRSARNQGRVLNYARENSPPAWKRTYKYESDSDAAGGESDDGMDGRQRNAKRMGVRTQNPKTFGHISGVEVGRWWASRMEASTDAVHAPTVAGISGNATVGAYSVALSGGYPDDVDLGEAFTYTGSGGRDLKGTKQNPKNLRTAPQTSDQTFENSLNAALKRSAETKKPVRVIRGFKLQSPYAPTEGYRYDGLYTVEKAWMGTGLTNGLLVCRYAFKRVRGQDPLPVRDLERERMEMEEE